jgi:hypothetical protein
MARPNQDTFHDQVFKSNEKSDKSVDCKCMSQITQCRNNTHPSLYTPVSKEDRKIDSYELNTTKAPDGAKHVKDVEEINHKLSQQVQDNL